MGKEIERKFLVKDTSFMASAVNSLNISQAYLSTNPDATVRIRISGQNAFLTIKSRNHGATRDEWEYPLPLSDANDMIQTCCKSNCIEKCRYIVPFAGRFWEVDVLGGRLSGLIIAEIELENESAEIDLPPYVGQEVTNDARFYNSALVSASEPPV